MSENRTGEKPKIQWLWWIITALLGVGLYIDINDGQILKIATSALLFIACLLSASVPPPRTGIVGGAITACFGVAILMMLYRAMGSGL